MDARLKAGHGRWVKGQVAWYKSVLKKLSALNPTV